jgi:hypothetical protein
MSSVDTLPKSPTARSDEGSAAAAADMMPGVFRVLNQIGLKTPRALPPPPGRAGHCLSQ